MIIRKITNVLGIILIFTVLSIYVFNKINIDMKPEILFYSLNETKLINSTKDHRINIYVYKSINVDELNYYFLDNDKQIKVDIEKIEYNGETKYNNYIYNSYSIKVLNEEKLKYKNLIILYNNNKYLLKLSEYLINLNKSELINYSYLKGHFAYINNNLYLIAITLKLDEDILLKNAYLSDNLYVITDLIKEEKIDENIIEPHDYHMKSNSNFLLKKDKYYYLPLGYKYLSLEESNTLVINDKKIELISFINSVKHLSNYPSYLNKGILYDQN